jgi:hypothetical protein
MKDISPVKALIILLVFIVSIILVFVGRAKEGYMGLLLEIIGIVGLILELYIYNKQYS